MQISLRTALLRSLAAPLLFALVAGSLLAYRIAGEVVSAAYDQSLVNLAEGVANRVRAEGDAIVLDLPAEAEAVLRTDRVDRIYFRVLDDGGNLVAGDAALPRPEGTTRAGRPHFYEAEFRGEAIRGVRLHQIRERESFFITVAETTGKRQQAVRDLLIGFGAALLLVVAAVAFVVRFCIPAALAPLVQVQRDIALRSGQDLAPLDLASAPDEIRPLVAMLNIQLDRLRAANHAQRQFLQDAAHQLRTPLASLQIQLELLESGRGDADTLTRLHRSVGRVTRLANQLLALARAEAGERLIADAPRVDLADLIDEMLDDWLGQADARRIDFGVEREHAAIAGDPTLLRELLANLVDNALKYTADGGQVTLRCRHAAAAVEIEVTDNGTGIPEAERERVFERFRRLPGGDASGSGLGLPIAREIARAHGGSIVITTPADGCGTRVCVRLPTAEAPAGAAA